MEVEMLKQASLHVLDRTHLLLFRNEHVLAGTTACQKAFGILGPLLSDLKLVKVIEGMISDLLATHRFRL